MANDDVMSERERDATTQRSQEDARMSLRAAYFGSDRPVMTCQPTELYIVCKPDAEHPTQEVVVSACCTCGNPDHYYSWAAQCVAMPATSALARKGYTL